MLTLKSINSNHLIPIIYVQTGGRDRGRGCYKMNNNILLYKEYKQKN